MPLIDGPDCKLSVEILGEGDPVTVFAHGVTGSTWDLRPLARYVRGTRVLFDFRGHGDSESPEESAGYDHAAARRDLECVADTFSATQAFGVSWGAGALCNLLQDVPNRFSRLGFFIPACLDEPNRGAGHFPAFAAVLESHPIDEVVARTLRAPEYEALFAVRPYWRELVRKRTERMNGKGVPRALRGYVAGDPPLRDAEVLRAVTAPALILSHEGDPVHDASVARRMAEMLPNTEVVIWPEPLAMYDDLEGFTRVIGEFFNAGT